MWKLRHLWQGFIFACQLVEKAELSIMLSKLWRRTLAKLDPLMWDNYLEVSSCGELIYSASYFGCKTSTCSSERGSFSSIRR